MLKSDAVQHKKPSLLQKLTKSGMARQQAQLTVGEQLAKAMMRRRARKRSIYFIRRSTIYSEHYVETRDDLELKVARINRRLIKLVHEGDHVSLPFDKDANPELESVETAV